MRGSVVAAAVSAIVCLSGGAADAKPEHPCAKAAAEQARQLLLFHFGPGGLVEIDQSVTAVAPIRNPANTKQRLDVLEVWEYVYKARYRMRLIYKQVPGACTLIGQEVLEYANS